MRVPGQQRKSYAWRWTAALAGLAVLTFALVMAVMVRPAERVEASTFAVNSVLDTPNANDSNADGAVSFGELPNTSCGSPCTLRSAVFAANSSTASAGDTINISVNGIITLTNGTLKLNDATGGTTITGNPNITVDGNHAPIACFEIDSANNVISGLNITNCGVNTGPGGAAIRITGAPATGNALRGNTMSSNGGGVEIDTGAANNTVGGTNAAYRNVIGNNWLGVYITNVGTSGNAIQGNFIGADASGNPLGNKSEGVTIDWGAAGNFIGGTAAQANTIAWNTGSGVKVDATFGNAWADPIRRNPIYLNGVSGISLVANGNQNAPAPTISISQSSPGGPFTVAGTLPPFYGVGSEVDVFKGDSTGQGREYLGTATVLNASGGWNISVCGLTATDTVVATATDTYLVGDTSPFSAPLTVGLGSCIVTPPTPTPTPTPTGPTPTPTGPTPTPGAAMQSVPLAINCNPIASTYPDATAIATIASAVAPSGILASIWSYDPFTVTWYGYDPAYPTNPPSDLITVDRLDAFFICDSAPGTWSRPQI